MGQSASFLTHPLPHLKESSFVSFVRYDNLSEPSHKSSHTSSHKSYIKTFLFDDALNVVAHGAAHRRG